MEREMGEENATLQVARNSTERVYWARARSDSFGIVVAAAWMLSKPWHFNKHSGLYASCAWDCLVAHPKFLLLWAPLKARALAIRVLDKLLQELKARPRPVVFATFSGGFKSCLYQLFEVLNESYEGGGSALEKYRIVRDCYAGQIHDSSPVDFVHTLGATFFLDRIYLRTKIRNAAITWSARAISTMYDSIFHSRLERERADMWKIAYISAAWGPILVLCSKDDELAPFDVIQNYNSRLSSLGCKVTLIVWENSIHCGHIKKHPDEYKSAVGAFLSDAVASFALKSQNGSISGSVTSSSILGGQTSLSKDTDPVSVKHKSQSSGNARVMVWIPARM